MSLPTPDGAISVQGLYVKDHKSESFLLRNINFEVNPGEVLLVTGPSGAGKTSLLRAIIGINLVHSGNIRIDGFDSKAWNPDELGQHIGYVPQDIGLLDGTIAENIARFGDIDREYLSDACELAGLNQLVEMLPEGVATKIGSGARILSGGQRQLVALSRALYGSPKIFLLDEPNSGLDSFGAQKLMLAIEALKKKGCTTIIVSHRTSVLPLIDKILVLANGAVLSFGSKNDVLAKHQNTRKTQVVA
jgi:ABC-type protease/lipase transport system fused ATPase/permease subunit